MVGGHNNNLMYYSCFDIYALSSGFEKQFMDNLTDPSSELGACNMLELTAFGSTPTRSADAVCTGVEELGGMVQCIANKENMMYCVDVLKENFSEAIEIVADSIVNAQLSDDEIEGGKLMMQIMQTELPSDFISRDAVQRAAYGSGLYSKIGCNVGNYHVPPSEECIANITTEKVRNFKKTQFYGENIVISAVGVNHDYFVDLVKKHFSGIQSNVGLWKVRNCKFDEPKLPSEVPAYNKFTGGSVVETRNLKEPFVKTCVAFEIGGWHDDMLIATCVFQMLLGGGSSFSAGGPGKGMYTRLYKDVLNRHFWVESAQSFVTVQEGCGLIGIDGSCEPDRVSDMIQVIVDQIYAVAAIPVTAVELSRAKNMLKSMMFMQLESRLVLCEDLARQFTTYGTRADPTSLRLKIDAITAEDIMAVAKRAMNNFDENNEFVGPAVACVGHDVSHFPQYSVIKDFTKRYREAVIEKYGV